MKNENNTKLTKVLSFTLKNGSKTTIYRPKMVKTEKKVKK